MKEKYIENEDYNKVLIEVIEKAKSIFQDNLLNITLGGSGGKNNIIPGWSDLDLYFVFQKYDNKKVTQFNEFLKTVSVHVGTTYYTVCDIKVKHIDFKTNIMIYEKYHYDTNPTLYGEEIYLEIVPTFELIKTNDLTSLCNSMNLLKRQLLELTPSISKDKLNKYIKKLTVIIKCILTQHDYFEYGYVNVFDKFKMICKKLGINCFDEFDVSIYINNKYDNMKSLIEFSENLIKHIDELI